jgi:ATP-dependent RNA helicase DHX57
MVAQPQRLSVMNLKRHLHSQLGDIVGMRMGHGVREETENTKIYFVTTGYLVKLISHYPENLRSITHIVIDEVHERSLESDLLCWLVRNHMLAFPQFRVVLMSATLNSSLYADYFQGTMSVSPTTLSGEQ